MVEGESKAATGLSRAGDLAPRAMTAPQRDLRGSYSERAARVVSSSPPAKEPRDMFASPGGIAALLQRLERESSRFGSSGWRVRADAVEAAFDLAIDHYLDHKGAPPSDWLAYATAIYRNLARSGPPRAALSSNRTVSLLGLESDPFASADDRGQSRQDWASKLRLDACTAAELAAIHAALSTRSIRAAARAAGMTPRDLRIRLRRAAEKIRVANPCVSSPSTPPYVTELGDQPSRTDVEAQA